MISLLNKIRQLLSPRDKKIMVLLVLMMALGAVLEMIGVSILMPVIAVVTGRNCSNRTAICASFTSSFLRRATGDFCWRCAHWLSYFSLPKISLPD